MPTLNANTYGLHSINHFTFNLQSDGIGYPQEVRNFIISILRVNNATFNVLGYTKFAPTSGKARIGIWGAVTTVMLCIGHTDNSNGVIIGRWYSEALLMGIAQIARGALEAFCPHGKKINAALDLTLTFHNAYAAHVEKFGNDPYGYPDKEYPFPLSIPLYLA